MLPGFNVWFGSPCGTHITVGGGGMAAENSTKTVYICGVLQGAGVSEVMCWGGGECVRFSGKNKTRKGGMMKKIRTQKNW